MDNGRRTGWFETFGILGGAALGFKFGSEVGALLQVPPGTYGLLRWLVGGMVTWIAIMLLANAIQSRIESNPAGSSGIALYLRGLLLRLLARIIWASVLAAPVAIGFWIYRSGILSEILREVLR